MSAAGFQWPAGFGNRGRKALPGHRSVPHRDGSKGRIPAGLVFGAPVAVLVIAVIGSIISERPIAEFTRDVAAVASVPPYVGLVSTVGNIAWWSAASIAIFAAMLIVPVNQDRSEARSFLIWTAALTAMLGLDDTFMLHDRIFPRFLHLPELVLFAAYGLAAVALLWRFRALYQGRAGTGYLLAAAIFFACSIGVDRFDDLAIPYLHLLEDGPKLIGICAWLAFIVSIALQQSGPAPPGDGIAGEKEGGITPGATG